MARRRRTAAQRAASRRNLVKARRAKKIRPLYTKLILATFGIIIFLLLIVATRGLILLLVIGIGVLPAISPKFRQMLPFGENSKRMRAMRLENARQLAQLISLAPTEFEQTIGALLREMGFPKVEHVGGSGDLSVDLSGRDHAGAFFVAQCKRYSPEHKVGSLEIQQFIGMATVHHRAQRLLYFTTSTYTAPAISLAKQHSLELFTGEDIVRIANRLRAQAQHN